MIEEALQHLRSAVRVLAKSPGFSAAGVTLIALGIGGNTTIYTIINAALTKPMPGVQAERLISLGVVTNGQMDDPGNSYVNYLEYVAQSRTLRPILARGFERFTLTLEKASYGLRGSPVSTNYFETVGVRLVRGRPFAEDEDRLNASGLVAVISYRVWQDQFQGAENIVGRAVVLNGHPATIVGVTPRGFRGLQMGERLDVWVPLLDYYRVRGTLKELADPSSRSFEMIGRLAPGFSLSQARAEFETISKRLQTAYSTADKNMIALLEPYSALGPGIQQVRVFMAIMMVVAIITLLIVCANVANLMLARSVARQREMAVRQSLGASRSRILCMLLAEGLLLSLTAWVAAWLFARWAAQAIPRMIPTHNGIQVDLDFTPDWRVAAYAMCLAVFSTLAFTVAPALAAWRQELLPFLKAGEHNVSPGGSKLASILVVAQLALCVVLLTGAGLANRSLYLLNTLDLHLGQKHLLLITMNTSGSANGKEQNVALLDRLRERLRVVPGVFAASYARAVPPRSWSGQPVRTDGSREPVSVESNLVGPDYFRTVGVAPTAGRGLSQEDQTSAKRTAVINQDLAETLWPGRTVVGRTISVGAGKHPVEVIGVVPNGVFTGLRQQKRRNVVFLPEGQVPEAPGEATFHVLFEGSLDAVAPAIRAAVRETDFRVAIFSMETAETLLKDFALPVLVIAALLALIGTGTLLLAAIGLYAVIAFNMSKRTRDFGVRMALGASSTQILETVLKEGLQLTAIGLAVGFALSFAGAHALHSTLFGVTPTDKPTYLGVFVLLAIVSLLASYIPARRAARTDPMEALRQE